MLNLTASTFPNACENALSAYVELLTVIPIA